MQPRVRIAHGTAFDVVLVAAAVADPVWRDTFTAGPASHAHVAATAGDDFVRRVSAFGRFGWINMIGLMAAAPEAWGLARLLESVRSGDPEDLHLLMLGGGRRQLLTALDQPMLRRAIGGDAEARGALDRALSSDELVIEATPWLLETSSSEVHQTLLALLDEWQKLLLPPADEDLLEASLLVHAQAAEAMLAASPGRAFLDAAIGGLSYDPAGLDQVVSISTAQVAPIVVVVDGVSQTAIVHPPVDGVPLSSNSRERFLELSRAVGDKTRMQLLSMLQGGERTAVDLARGMQTPRTTLLHHLAILRAAGLVHVSVTPGGATLYRLRPDGFAELALAAGEFVPGPHPVSTG